MRWAAGFASFEPSRKNEQISTENRQERLREADALRFGLGEITSVAPLQGEDAELRAEEERLAHAVELKQAAVNVADSTL